MQVSNRADATEDEDKDKVATDAVTQISTDNTSSIQTSIDVTQGLERCLTVTVPAEQIDAKVDKRIQEARKTINLNGFRKGKAPFKVIKKRFGANFRQEVLNDVVNETFQKAITMESVKPVGQPDVSLKTFDESKDLHYTATFEIYPQVILGDFSAIEVTQSSADIEESDVDKMVQRLREQQSTYKPVERAAALDDEVTIDYLGTKDGESFSGGKAENQTLVLGSNSMIPGFEEGVVGMSVGEEKGIALTFPDDYHAEELKGADVEFTITMKQVAERILPPLDDQFVAKFGIADGDMDKFRADVSANMKRELDATVKAEVKKQVVDKLIESHRLELPKALVANEIEVLRQQMASRLQGASENKDIDLKAIFPDESLVEEAEHRVNFILLASEIAKSNNIVVDPKRVRSTINSFAKSYQQPETIVNYYYQNQRLLEQVRSSVLEDQVVEAVLNQAQVRDEKVGYFELVKR